MKSAILVYNFQNDIAVENRSNADIDAALYDFLQRNLASGKLVEAFEYRDIDNPIDYIEFPDKPEVETFVEIICDVPEDLLDDFQNKEAEMTAFLRQNMTRENLIYEDYKIEGNDKYFTVQIVRLEESHI